MNLIMESGDIATKYGNHDAGLVKRVGDAIKATRLLEYDDRDTLDVLANAALSVVMGERMK